MRFHGSCTWRVRQDASRLNNLGSNLGGAATGGGATPVETPTLPAWSLVELLLISFSIRQFQTQKQTSVIAGNMEL